MPAEYQMAVPVVCSCGRTALIPGDQTTLPHKCPVCDAYMKVSPPAKPVPQPKPSYVGIGFKLGFGGAFGLFMAYLILNMLGCIR